jgi:pyruvate/2-oxoglutarate dehydrogenase complex dihydrolipoamide acyltransferase (E2) component
LANLIATKAYQDIPLVELGQQQNPLLAGLAAEGASAAGVEAQSAQDAQIAAQLAALTRGAMGQLNVGEENYLKALQNAVRYEAGLARQSLAGRQYDVERGIGSEYDQLAQQIAQQRLESVSAAERQAAEAAAQAQGFAPIDYGDAPAAFDYGSAMERARQQAMEQIRKAMPKAAPKSVTTSPKTSDLSSPTGVGTISDSFGRVTLPYQNLPKGATLTNQQIKRLMEAQDIQELRRRGL